VTEALGAEAVRQPRASQHLRGLDGPARKRAVDSVNPDVEAVSRELACSQLVAVSGGPQHAHSRHGNPQRRFRV
jgi:hypothetical protein